MGNKDQRNFLLEEINKRIIGPGFSEEVYLCDKDASDEILNNRPQIVYSAGAIFPQVSEDTEEEAYNPDEESDVEDDSIKSTLYLTDDTSDAENSLMPDKNDTTDNQLPDPEDVNQFIPSHIGLVTCLESSVKNVDVEINYGQYHLLNQSNYLQNVHVLLGRCTIDQLNKTFDYYDKYAQDILMSVGVKSVKEMFIIDESNKYISPKKLYEIEVTQTDGSVKERYLRPGDFPSLLQNKAASIITKALRAPSKSHSIKSYISWDDLKEQMSNFDKIPQMNALLESNGFSSLEDVIRYNEDDLTVHILKGRFTVNDVEIEKLLYVDDPVKSIILDKLLQFKFFKRTNINSKVTINLEEKYLDVNEDVQLAWKVIPSSYNSNRKYLRILLINKHKKSVKNNTEDYIFQAKLSVHSNSIISYTEPHRSAVEDDEYEMNEVIYSDELVYAKGVNCAATWEQTNEPHWVQTTYVPNKIVKTFATSSDNDDVNQACCIYDMSIWSTVPKEEIIDRFRKMADAYMDWHKSQEIKAASNIHILKSIIDNQEEFVERLKRNIDYLEKSDRAYNCFLLANTSMYIQMVLGRDKFFSSKARLIKDYDLQSHFFDRESWGYFSANKSAIKPSYRPFQLAFLLMNIESTFENDINDRNKNVDLIWFPTGGGKTEAYLALTALTIAERRTSNDSNNEGVSVIMRYTLRLLTAQQFERASFLICAMEYLRKELSNRRQDYNYSLGDKQISIGLWIGQASTPNKVEELTKEYKYKSFFDTIEGNHKHGLAPQVPAANPFPVSYCPWCGCNLVSEMPPTNQILKGYNADSGKIHCIRRNCAFHYGLPIYYIDEQLYKDPPTLLFATVDKFAQLYKRTTGNLFGIGTKRRRPDLIIQDELHLISGPLGSIVGMFETMVEELCTERASDGTILRKPKIIASTATTRNTNHLIKQLYNRTVKTFPVSGVRYDDNFFSHIVSVENSKRLYSGISPTGHTSAELEIRTIAAELVAKEKMIRNYLIENGVDLEDKIAVQNALFKNSKLIDSIDNYWSLVIYYKDLKSLGRTHSRIGQEIYANTMSMRSFINTYPSLDFILYDFSQRTNEFTSRQDSSRIKQLLIEASEKTRLKTESNGSYRIASKMDIVQATNMISVGIDIARWNVMLMIGQPMTTADYIQASSRVGRTFDGLIINILNPMRARELSLFENYEPYHQVFYKYVEPLSATTFTEMTLHKLLTNLYLCYMVLVRNKKKPIEIKKPDLDCLKQLLESRCKAIGTYKNYISYMNDRIDSIDSFFHDVARVNEEFSKSITNDTIMGELQDKFGPLMRSLRDVESNSFVLYE